ncbi:unnamed protein product [Ambrosiozyma monospora]|uniref:Unnamed protein product n=1 Tax=Ambrosiozyma monospora TaxID=43982 RepID=A0A9W6Z3R6_AMBMO|nr:unnamed protein product [Ambrosiozyma monospora]
MFKYGMRGYSTQALIARKWSSSEVLTLHKSKFKGWCIPITSNSEIKPLVQQLYTLDTKLLKASHPEMLAWKTADGPNDNSTAGNSKRRVTKKKSSTLVPDPSVYTVKKLTGLNQGFNDNGEGGSGLRLLGLLDRLKLVNVLVVVTRWYGGTPLGPVRFKCISDVAHGALKNGGYTNLKPEGNAWLDLSKLPNN